MYSSNCSIAVFCQYDEDQGDVVEPQDTENPDYTENPGDTGNQDDIETQDETENPGETEEAVDDATIPGETTIKQKTASQIILELQTPSTCSPCSARV